jgi:8-oxo-dGTP pyrophosphatase MutT (NUDIX family)
MKISIESWRRFLKEGEDMSRVSKAIMVGDVEGFSDSKILILRRSKELISKESPWEWDLPGGHVQEGESDKHGLSREVQEETGLVLSHVPNWFALSGYTRFYMVYDWAGELKLSHEHDDYEWIYPEEATNYNLGKMYTQAIQDAFRKE